MGQAVATIELSRTDVVKVSQISLLKHGKWPCEQSRNSPRLRKTAMGWMQKVEQGCSYRESREWIHSHQNGQIEIFSMWITMNSLRGFHY